MIGKLVVRGEVIEKFVQVSGKTVEDARFSVVTKMGTRVPTCRATRISAKYLDEEGKRLLKEHLDNA